MCLRWREYVSGQFWFLQQILFSLLVNIKQHSYVVFFHPPFADDNKPIWMHAEEREESKVSHSV